MSACFIYSTDVTLALFCHCCASNLHSGLLLHSSDLSLILNVYICKLELYSSVFIHCINVPLNLNSHNCKSELDFAVFMHNTNLVVTLRSDCCRAVNPPFLTGRLPVLKAVSLSPYFKRNLPVFENNQFSNIKVIASL